MVVLAILVFLFTDKWNMNSGIFSLPWGRNLIYPELKTQAEMVVVHCGLIFRLVGTSSVKWSKPHFSNLHYSVESSLVIALVLLYCALWLVNKNRATFSTNEKLNQNQSCLARTLFPALGASYMYLLRILIGSLRCLRLLWLVRVITLVLVLRHSIENRSSYKC